MVVVFLSVGLVWLDGDGYFGELVSDNLGKFLFAHMAAYPDDCFIS